MKKARFIFKEKSCLLTSCFSLYISSKGFDFLLLLGQLKFGLKFIKCVMIKKYVLMDYCLFLLLLH